MNIKRLPLIFGVLSPLLLIACADEQSVPAMGEVDARVSTVTYLSDISGATCCVVIAHAGGAIDGNAYTNSLEAITRNHEAGIRLFELDFLVTSDSRWVAAHDWPRWQEMTGYAGKIAPDLETFEDLPLHQKHTSWGIQAEYSPLSFEGLEDFLSDHPDAVIVTDLKTQYLFDGFVTRVLDSRYRDQFIFQAYTLEQIDIVVMYWEDNQNLN